MSRLQKAISRIQRREGPRLGFGSVAREQPRAMLAAVTCDPSSAAAMAAAGADLVVLDGGADPVAAVAAAGDVRDAVIGVRLAAADADLVDRLGKAGCDFAISPLDGTAAAALAPDGLGLVVAAPSDITDTTLRALAPLGLDALFVEVPVTALSLAGQLNLVRLASFASTPLLVTAPAVPAVADLRVLRDSGVAAVLLPGTATAADVESLVAGLKAVPAPRKARGQREVAIVPAHSGEAGHDEDDDGHDVG